ncbi:hypothetical protein D3C85_788620 [compost metagenome]
MNRLKFESIHASYISQDRNTNTRVLGGLLVYLLMLFSHPWLAFTPHVHFNNNKGITSKPEDLEAIPLPVYLNTDLRL